jgi:hypothetical protein
MTKQSFRVGDAEYTVEKLDLPLGATRADAETALRHAIDNCPECQAAGRSGHGATLVSGRELLRGLDRFRRPRWRELKRRVRR